MLNEKDYGVNKFNWLRIFGKSKLCRSSIGRFNDQL